MIINKFVDSEIEEQVQTAHCPDLLLSANLVIPQLSLICCRNVVEEYSVNIKKHTNYPSSKYYYQ